MHVAILVITHSEPDQRQLERITLPWNDRMDPHVVEETLITWDWWEVGGRFDKGIALAGAMAPMDKVSLIPSCISAYLVDGKLHESPKGVIPDASIRNEWASELQGLKEQYSGHYATVLDWHV